MARGGAGCTCGGTKGVVHGGTLDGATSEGKATRDNTCHNRSRIAQGVRRRQGENVSISLVA
jgi:hypothetical protein